MFDTISNRISRASSFADDFYKAGDIPALDPGREALESTSEFRVVEKKKRVQRGTKKNKGPALDLAISDTATESSRAPSPTPATSPIKTVTNTVIKESIERIEAEIEVLDHPLDPISTQTSLDETEMSQLTNAGRGDNSNFNSQDAFDSEEWDPELPSVDDTGSPKPIQVKPQPIAYTTVGSLVDPNVKPHFSAPNRIQREGTNRQPLLSIMNSQQRPSYNSYLHGTIGAPAPLTMANSMAYAQSLQSSMSPGHTGPKQIVTPPGTSNRPTVLDSSHQFSLSTGKEKGAEILKSVPLPPLMTGNASGSPRTKIPPTSSKLSAFAPTFENKSLVVEEVRNISSSTKDAILGVPAGLTATIMPAAKSMKVAAESARNAEVVMGLATFENGFSELLAAVKRGNLDRDFQFPTGLPSSTSRKQSNPLFGAQNSLAYQSNTARGSLPIVRGYPQPLTAGPPGQRQVARVFPQPIPSNLESIWGQSTASFAKDSNAYLNQLPGARLEISSIWQNAVQPPHTNVYTSGLAEYPASIPTSGPYPVPSYDHISRAAPLCDSLPPEAILKYYPFGIPQDMNGSYRKLSDEKQKALDEAHLNVVQKKAQEVRSLDDTFYYGQRRFATMDGADYVQELEERERARKNFGPIAPPKKVFPPGPAIKKIISKEDMEKMSIAEASLPCVEAAFGTLLAYADTAPCSRRHLSRFTEPANWQVDNSEDGNKSMFGEDWGRPPKRFGRDSRRQGDF